MNVGPWPLLIAGTAVLVLPAALLAVPAAPPPAPTAATASAARPIAAVAAESQYADVIRQIGGRYVRVHAVLRNPDTDPHAFELSPSIARAVSDAALVVQNGAGYDPFMSRLESASPNAQRRVINVQAMLGLPVSTPNPHLWYKPAALRALAGRLRRALSAAQPGHRRYFQARARHFGVALAHFGRALRAFRARYGGTPVATTEPVGDYLLAAAGVSNRTPWQLQADAMNGTDPAPQQITQQDSLLRDHRVRALLYNAQVSDQLSARFRAEASAAGIPIVALYETLPRHYSYQGWMLAELRALRRALNTQTSTTQL